MDVINDSVAASLPPDTNSIATFYLLAVRITENEGQPCNEKEIYIHFVRNIKKPLFSPESFIVANGLHYITADDEHVATQADAMSNYFFGGSVNNTGSDIFDPTSYKNVDLMDARAAMDKKNLGNDYTFASVKIKYCSEVLFLGQTNTTVQVSTPDKVLTENMDFIGQTSSLSKGEKVRVYYTISKEPLEKWEVQAIEKL